MSDEVDGDSKWNEGGCDMNGDMTRVPQSQFSLIFSDRLFPSHSAFVERWSGGGVDDMATAMRNSNSLKQRSVNSGW